MNPYQGRRVALLTQHGKETLLRQPLAQALGCELVHTDAHDTDQLGTFTRDVPRIGSQLDAARTKAQLGMQLTGADIGLASEGAFGADPVGGLMPWDTELLLWVDRAQGLEVQGLAQGPAQNQQRALRSLQDLDVFAVGAGFPRHRLVLRTDHDDGPIVAKGVADWDALRQAFAQAMAQSTQGIVVVENDLRAFANPTRQQLILEAARDLIRKLRSICPACKAPGYWIARHIAGLPCRACGRPSRLARAHIWSCPACQHEVERRVESPAWVDPSRCDHCNP